MGTDGASANIAIRGLKGLVEAKLDLICWMWCLTHRLELAIKNALTGTAFDHIDDMLTRLFYLCSKSSKKCTSTLVYATFFKLAQQLPKPGPELVE